MSASRINGLVLVVTMAAALAAGAAPPALSQEAAEPIPGMGTALG